jgi:hypothetical protein
MLNHPGESLVLQADFLDMVERVDVCIEFLRAHVSMERFQPASRSLAEPLRISPNTMKPKYTCCVFSNASLEQ